MREKPKRRGVSFQRRGVLTCLLFVSPWLVGAAVFFLYPLFYSLRLSFGVIENPATQKVVFAGFENFRVAFMEDARFFPMLLSIAKDTLINTPLIVVFALFIATLLSKDIRGKGLFRSVFFLPVILGTGFVMQQLLGVQMNADAVEVARGILLPEKVVRFLNPGVTQVILEFLSRVTLVNLTENLLSITRIENGTMRLQMEAQLLDEVFQEALSHLDRQAAEHRIAVELPDDLLMARIDVRLIVQVIINIVNNAVKYTPAGSHILLRAEKQGTMVAVSIADDGPGIPEEAKAHLFDMFYTASQGKSDNRRGLGLGLSLCRSIVSAHGGVVTVSDNHPHGAVFTFTLPLEEVDIHV